MTAYWVALGLSMFVFVLALLGTFRHLDLGKIDDRRIRQYRLSLEGRRGPFAFGFIVMLSMATLWLIIAIEEIALGSPRGFAYLVPAILFFAAIWLMRRSRDNALHDLGDRGLVPKTASEEKAKVWYRLWGAIVIVGFVGPSVMEFHYQRSFSTEETFSDAASTVHFLLTICLIIGVIGLLITYFNTRESEKKDRDAA